MIWLFALPAKQDVSPAVVDVKVDLNFIRSNSNSPEEELSPQAIVRFEGQLRTLKGQGKVLETDQEAVRLSRRLQRVCQLLLEDAPHKQVTMSLQFPDTMISEGEPKFQQLILSLAPLDLMPYAVYKFLQIVKHWQGGAFHRNAGHVLQAQVTDSRESMAFQEYHAQFPHVKYTLGFAGRPGGPAFYISTIDNTQNHGPASQGSSSEADSCFGEILASSRTIVDRMQTQPGADQPHGFIDARENWIIIQNFTVT
jgi:hypothetical protein